MTNYKKQILSVVAAGAVVLNMAVPAFAADTIVISGNGSGSSNTTSVSQTNTTSVSQNNTANVTNNVTSNANSGGNDANYNTGGDVLVHTGAAQTTANVTNTLNSNAAQVAGCNCGSDTNVTISDNGAFSKNQVGLAQTNTNAVDQTNYANVTNNVNNTANSGKNDANLNTGGDVVVITGDASSDANVKTTANSNTAVVGGAAGATVTPTASFKILGNGAGSSNWITAGLTTENAVGQSNDAKIVNNVNAKANSGDNDANYNTGGDVVISTGDAMSHAGIDNMTNFNVANLDCGCTLDVLAKIEGNGASSLLGQTSDGIVLGLTNENALEQANCDYLLNNANTDAKTGYNDAKLNTGSVSNLNDPAIITGDAVNTTDVNNAGNVNTVGQPVVVTLPGGSTVGLSFNVQALLAFFGMSI